MPKRSSASTVFEELRSEVLVPALIERVETIAQAADFVPRATTLMSLVKNRSPLYRQLGAKIFELHPDLAARDASREARALARKAGGTVH